MMQLPASASATVIKLLNAMGTPLANTVKLDANFRISCEFTWQSTKVKRAPRRGKESSRPSKKKG